MALVIGKSKTLTDRDANVKSGASRQGGLVRNGAGAAEIANGDSIGSKFLLATLPSNARITGMNLSSDAISGAVADIGLYKATQDGGAVVDADFFAVAKSLTAAQYHVNVAFTGAAMDIAFSEKTLWEALGLASDPNVFYDVVLTLTAAATGAGTVATSVNFVI